MNEILTSKDIFTKQEGIFTKSLSVPIRKHSLKIMSRITRHLIFFLKNQCVHTK